MENGSKYGYLSLNLTTLSDKKGIKVPALAKGTGLDKDKIYRARRGTGGISGEDLQKLADFLKISNPVDLIEKKIDWFNLKDYKEQPLLTQKNNVDIRQFRLFNMQACAGSKSDWIGEECYELVHSDLLSTKTEDLITISGDSMMPDFSDKDIVGISAQINHISELIKGKAYIIAQPNQVALCKEFVRINAINTIFKSRNANYPDEVIISLADFPKFYEVTEKLQKYD